MESVKTIRAVERAFQVLQALQEHPAGATLIELQAATGLSGPTLLRLLKTLMAVHAVRRSMTDQRYRNSIQLQGLTRDMDPLERLADVAAPWLDRLCLEVEWPSDFVVHCGDQDHMNVLESSLRQSRFYVRRSLGRVRVNLLGSAAGAAFMAALPTARRDHLVALARAGKDVHNKSVVAAGNLVEEILRARARGYACRHRLYRGGSYLGKPRDDALDAIAVPVLCADVVLGALNINWNRSACSQDQMVHDHLPRLRRTADSIAQAALQAGLLREWPDREPSAHRTELGALGVPIGHLSSPPAHAGGTATHE